MTDQPQNQPPAPPPAAPAAPAWKGKVLVGASVALAVLTALAQREQQFGWAPYVVGSVTYGDQPTCRAAAAVDPERARAAAQAIMLAPLGAQACMNGIAEALNAPPATATASPVPTPTAEPQGEARYHLWGAAYADEASPTPTYPTDPQVTPG